ncbi:MAG: metallophosphoesterase family protein [Candidatus Entotheonellia bacterium]
MNASGTESVLIGVISDTHGLLRPEAVQALQGVDLLIHAGDIGRPEVLEGLRSIAPVIAIRGNNDTGPWARSLAATEVVEAGQAVIYVLHNVKELDLDPAAAGFSAVISGHSHQPSVAKRGDVLFVNPGSAGPRRFKLPVSVARLQVQGASLTAEVVPLAV